MTMKLINVAGLVLVLSALTGCGDGDRVIERKTEVKDNGSQKTKETVLHQNPDGSTTKIETKTETKVKDGTHDDTILKIPGIEVKKE